jgi:hypothetical protein
MLTSSGKRDIEEKFLKKRRNYNLRGQDGRKYYILHIKLLCLFVIFIKPSFSYTSMYIPGVHLSFSTKLALRVGCERTTDYTSRISCLNPTSFFALCFCVFILQTGEWCVHNRLFDASFEGKLK